MNLQRFAMDRTEAPTPHRRREARRQGRVALSRELAVVASLLAGVGTAALLSQPLFGGMALVLRRGLAAAARPSGNLVSFGEGLLWPVAAPALAVMAAALVAEMGVSVLQTGLLITPPRFTSPFSPARLARWLSADGVWELVRSLLKLFLLGAVGYAVVAPSLPSLPLLAAFPLPAGAQTLLRLSVGLALAVGAGGLALAALDYAYQRWGLERSLRMTRAEVREELRRLEGAPEVKRRLRMLQRRAARMRMIQRVRHADVVVTNPQHVAVALEYREERMQAPQVVAKGQGHLARRIREEAARWRVPVVEDPPLAWSLYRTVDVGQEIRPELYRAVATILAHLRARGGR